MAKKSDKKFGVIILKNSAGGAELCCNHRVPNEINELVDELRINLFSQYSDIFRNLRDGKKEHFSFCHKHKGFTIIFSSVFD